jgi:hypothetical protein
MVLSVMMAAAVVVVVALLPVLLLVLLKMMVLKLVVLVAVVSQQTGVVEKLAVMVGVAEMVLSMLPTKAALETKLNIKAPPAPSSPTALGTLQPFHR